MKLLFALGIKLNKPCLQSIEPVALNLQKLAFPPQSTPGTCGSRHVHSRSTAPPRDPVGQASRVDICIVAATALQRRPQLLGQARRAVCIRQQAATLRVKHSGQQTCKLMCVSAGMQPPCVFMATMPM